MWELLWIQKEQQHRTYMASRPTMFHFTLLQREFSFFCRPCWVGQKKHWEAEAPGPHSQLSLGGLTLMSHILLGLSWVSCRMEIITPSWGSTMWVTWEVSEMLGFMSITTSRPHRVTFSYSQVIPTVWISVKGCLISLAHLTSRGLCGFFPDARAQEADAGLIWGLGFAWLVASPVYDTSKASYHR